MRRLFRISRSTLFSAGFSIVACTKAAPSYDGPTLRDGGPALVGHTLTLSPKGYLQSCMTRPILTVSESDGGSRVIDQARLERGSYFLDGKFSGPMMCDLVVCAPAVDVPVELVEYQKIGDRLRPDGAGNVPDYRTVELKGKITVTLESYFYSSCAGPQKLTETITR